ncbi:NAD(+)-dependent deacetylase [Tieghemostelium lacteum]|uniref:NAD(+)-dependent deacetylase n=1 Tax=Tieghemostelium lacteum TaxID=361077 RepID=A0A151ZE73_TIELA|nr:NAD(+)-dependent deacetylase [Tieghemostelium lacteum]|eukprot:KYQ92258.1 NAD(+)-dependent deacetylase [Tieghemostelium lacteum]
MNKRPLDESSFVNDESVKKIKSLNQKIEIQSDDDDDEVDVEINDEIIEKINQDAKQYNFVCDEYPDETFDENDDEDNSSVINDEEDLHQEHLNEIKSLQKLSSTTNLDIGSVDFRNLVEVVDENGDLVELKNIQPIDIKGSKEEEGEKKEEESKENEENGAEKEEELTEDETIEIAAKSFIYNYIQEKKDAYVDPIEFTRDLGFKLELEDNDEPWKIITAFLTRKKIAVMLLLNYLKYNSFIRPFRRKLGTVNNFEDVINLFQKCQNIVVITGAGISVSSGIPDFRSKDGIYEQIEKKYSLPNPESLFDIRYLRNDPRAFFEFAKEIYPGNHKPTPTHHFIKRLDNMGKLLRNYTQNIDTLEHVVGITEDRLVNCHGSFHTSSCMQCRYQVSGHVIREQIMNGTIPKCEKCPIDSNAFMKPDIVFFGENLPERFDHCVSLDLPKVDLIVVMGSSLQVQPVALLPDIFDKSIPQILVNREIVGEPHEFDYVYLGDCDNFVKELISKIGWDPLL